MKNILKFSSYALVLILFLSGCTHKIEITPDTDEIVGASYNLKSNEYKVGYFIDPSDQNLFVVTPGGGGDKIGYTPYKDTEMAFRSVLLKKFKKVYKVNSLTDNKFISEKNIKFLFTYKLVTNSSSNSAFTWPPTNFTISMDCTAFDDKGKNIWEKRISQAGNASFSEFKNDFSLSARRASVKVFQKLLLEIDASKELNNE